jgi:hypothetical protein
MLSINSLFMTGLVMTSIAQEKVLMDGTRFCIKTNYYWRVQFLVEVSRPDYLVTGVHLPLPLHQCHLPTTLVPHFC